MSGALWLDVRHAARLLRRTPIQTAVALLTLALGMGATTLVGAVARSVLLRPLPYVESDRLVLALSGTATGPAQMVHTGNVAHAIRDAALGSAAPRVGAPRGPTESMTDVAMLTLWRSSRPGAFDVVTAEGARRLRGGRATTNFFTLLGVQPLLGRAFDARDEQASVALLSHRLWRHVFGGDPAIIGRTLRLGGTPQTVIGVLPPTFEFTYPDETEIWTPLPWSAVPRNNAVDFYVVGRLAADVSIAQADARLSAMASRSTRSAIRDATFRWQTLHEYAFGRTRAASLLLVTLVAVVLLIACVNVTNLQLARLGDRETELALRAALGAGRARLLRHQTLESGLLAAGGGLLGLAIAALGVPVLRAIVPATVPRAHQIAIDGWTLALLTLACLLTTLACGLLPALGTRRHDLQRALAHGHRSQTGRSGARRWHGWLAATQVAFVIALLACAGLLLQSLWKLQHVDLGFDGARVLTMQMRIMQSRYLRDEDPTQARMRRFESELMAGIRALPGVTAAGVTSAVPMRGVDALHIVEVEHGHDSGANSANGMSGASQSAPAAEGVGVNYREVDPDYLALLRIPLLRGRPLTAGDTAESPRVALLSQSAAARLFPGVDPLGRRVVAREAVEIVGIVGDVRTKGVDLPPSMAMYVPREQSRSTLMCLVIRTTPEARDMAAQVLGLIRALDPEQPVEGITTLDQVTADTVAERRASALATGGFAILALLLAAVGLYGVVSYAVTRRVREIGVRAALGAQRRDLTAVIVRQGLRPVIAGGAVGVLIALAGGRALRRFLFDVTPDDPATLVSVAALVLLLSLMACWIPARRAARLDPLTALRHD